MPKFLVTVTQTVVKSGQVEIEAEHGHEAMRLVENGQCQLDSLTVRSLHTWAPSAVVVEEDDFFGRCPVCGGNDGYLNLCRAHWFFCEKHKVKWCRGDNLFSSWRHESAEDWAENARRLADYQEIDMEKATR